MRVLDAGNKIAEEPQKIFATFFGGPLHGKIQWRDEAPDSIYFSESNAQYHLAKADRYVAIYASELVLVHVGSIPNPDAFILRLARHMAHRRIGESIDFSVRALYLEGICACACCRFNRGTYWTRLEEACRREGCLLRFGQEILTIIKTV